MIPDDIRAALTADASKFTQTRWTFAQATQHHVIEVLEVRDDKAFCATLYSDPFCHWHIPLAEFFSEFSAFSYLGTAPELQWVRGETWIFDSQASSPAFPYGKIKHIAGDTVHYTSPFRTNGTTPLQRFRERFRAVTDGEMQSIRDRFQPREADAYMMATMAQDQVGPIMGQMPMPAPMLANAGRAVRRGMVGPVQNEPYMTTYGQNQEAQGEPTVRPASWDHLMADEGSDSV